MVAAVDIVAILRVGKKVIDMINNDNVFGDIRTYFMAFTELLKIARVLAYKKERKRKKSRCPRLMFAVGR